MCLGLLSYDSYVVSPVPDCPQKLNRRWHFAMLAIVVCTAALAALPARAQSNEWAWMGGANEKEEPVAVYGTLGTPAPGNFPGAHQFSSTWTDGQGNFWLFGGLAYNLSADKINVGPFMNDLWEFSPSTNEWAWMGGSNTPGTDSACSLQSCGQSGVYGTLGSPAAGNVPGGRMGAASWVDTKGNFWLFGGQGYDSAGTLVFLNDLWEFNPSTNEWAWMGGSSTVDGTCFGNDVEGEYCGGEPGVYGTLGTASATNVPGGRYKAMAWVDQTGNLWLFGGYTVDYTTQDMYDFNDLWKFNPSTNQWTWMGGNSSQQGEYCVFDPNSYLYMCGQAGIYGTLGSPSAVNMPGSRETSMGFTDKNGNLWLIGGTAFDSGGNYNPLNDVWKFNPVTNQWAWVGGTNVAPGCVADWDDSCGGIVIPPIDGSNGTLGMPAATNIPGLFSAAASWKDKSGNFWAFAGTNGDFRSGSNDLWKFDPSSNEWTWMGGASITSFAVDGIYGTEGMAAAGNFPGSRFGAASWTDSNGYLWLFGGFGTGGSTAYASVNDLWEYQPSTAPLPVTANPVFSVSSGSYSSAQAVTISDATNGAVFYVTTDGSTPIIDPSDYYSGQTPLNIQYSSTVKAIAVAFGCVQSAPVTANYTLSTTVATPTFSLPSGTYNSTQTDTITDATPGIQIFYTTDGTTPTTSSPGFDGSLPTPITVSTTETIKAIAIAYGYSSNSAGASAVASATYTINLPPASTPTFSIPAGAYGSAQTVIINDSTPNATIYYTIDGSTPTVSSTPFGGPVTITVSSSETIKAIAIANGDSSSPVAAATYTINMPAPSFAVSAASSLMTVSAGGSSAVVLTVTPQNGFNSTVGFTCSGLPAGVTCAFSPATVTPSGSSSATTQLTIAASSSASIAKPGSRPFVPYAALAALFGFIGIGLRRQRLLRWMLFLIAALPMLAVISACGGGSTAGGGSGGTNPPPETANVTVTATAGGLQQTATIALTVN
jgi:N-acetylneuraminic acid mutarotase